MNPALVAWLQRAVEPLTRPPERPPWNLDALQGLPLPPTLRPAAVLVGVVARAQPAVLLTRRAAHLRDHPGQVGFPGGRIEGQDASPAAAALREAQEEIGVEQTLVQPLGYLDPLATVTGFQVQPVLALVAPGYQPRLQRSEVAEVFEVPLSLLLDPARVQTVSVEFGGRSHQVFQYDYAPQRIWGATAAILVNLRQRLLTAQSEQRSE
jgi:8-oxo-dGTP pyrophosphatase MutT (NUDIX family)